MLQEICENGKRDKNKDSLLSLIPVIIVLLAHSIVKSNALKTTLSAFVYGLAIVVAIVVYYLVYRFRLSSYRYTITEDENRTYEDNAFAITTQCTPAGKILMFERIAGKGVRLYETVYSNELLELVQPGQEPRTKSADKPIVAVYTPRTIKDAYTLIYQREGQLHSVFFHPTKTFAAQLNQLISKTKKSR